MHKLYEKACQWLAKVIIYNRAKAQGENKMKIYEVKLIGANYSREWYADSPKEAIKLEQWKRKEDGLRFYPMREFEAIEIK